MTGLFEKEVEELRYSLAQAQEAAGIARQDAERLRAPAAIDVSEDVPAGEGSQSLDEEVKLHVEAIRVELEARHDERLNQIEETYKKRAEGMRIKLTKKLADGKDQMRQALAVEHEQALDALRSSHRQELEQLELRHHDEIAELRRNEESTFAQFKETWLREHPTAAPEGENTITAEDQTPKSPWKPTEGKPTEAEAREFVSTNATVRSILRNNISSKVKEAKDTLSVELKEEHEKLLAQRLKEVQDKAEAAKDHAVYTEGKRFALKLNLADNRSKVAQAKLEVVQKAAQETPEEPVGKVWALAKDAKPPVQAPQTIAPPAPNVSRATTFGQPTPIAPRSSQHSSDPKSINPEVPTSAEAQGNLQQRSNTEITESLIQLQDSQRPTPLATVTLTEGTITQPAITQPAITQSAIAQPANTQSGPPSSLPVKLQPNNAPQQPHTGTGPGTGRGLQQSGLPIARGGLSRGVPNSRGRGQGMGRGGPPTVDASRAQGNKRVRDDSQDGQPGIDEGNSKRIRGGSVGS